MLTNFLRNATYGFEIKNMLFSTFYFYRQYELCTKSSEIIWSHRVCKRR